MVWAMAALDALDQMKQRAARIGALVAGVLVIGTIGYRLVSHGQSTWIDCLYMVVITVATIGYGEVVPLDHSPGGRIFTMLVALLGIGIITYVMSTVTQVAVDGDLQRRWRRRNMLKAIAELSEHYLVCGWGALAPQIIRELRQTGRAFVVVVADRERVLKEMGDEAPDFIIEGDPTDDDSLRKAGVERAAGVFAADDEDHTNIVLSMAVRGLNAGTRIVASVRDGRNASKVKKAGASSVVSPITIGALRMSSEMVRPSVVTFLDVMLRDKDRNLRIEDVPVGEKCGEKPISALALDRYENSVLLAARRGDSWVFKPKASHVLAKGDVLVFMTTPEERQRLCADLAPN